LSKQLEGNARLRRLDREEKIFDEGYCWIIGVAYKWVKKDQLGKFDKLRMK